MKSSVLLDSVVFQLTPTRTRCDLVIFANGKSEKIASGFLDPFLAHLKAAMEQMGKGGYSIVLEPKQGKDSVWFTKGTVERFVRFVSTPEILERVYTIESEILQIEQAISTESDAGMHMVHDLPVQAGERIEGSKPAPGNEKAIVLYQPTTHQVEGDESTTQEKNSKVQLVRVLETRKTVLQKEQGMAFARAVAAGFDIENIAALHSFAQCFGASRMMDACKRFVDLWKAKHESGQWVDVEATETNMPSMGPSGIMLLGSNERGESKGSWPPGEVVYEKNGISSITGAEGKPQADHHGQPSLNEHNSGQFPHPMYPPWQMHSQANGLPIFQPYAMPGMPYYQNHPGNGPFFQPSYPLDDSLVNSAQRRRQRRHSMDSRDLSGDSESQELDASRKTMQGDVDTDEEYSVTQRSRKKGGKSSRKQSRTVVIRNINYITREKHDRSVSDPDSCSNSGTEDGEQNEKADEVRKLKKKTSLKEERMSNDDGHWDAFQSFLLKDADEGNSSARHDMFAKEGKDQGRKRQSTVGDASSMLGGRMGENQNRDFSKGQDISEDMTCMRKTADDKMLNYGTEANFESMINRKERLTDVWDSSLDPVITNRFQGSSNNNSRGTPHDMVDDSLMVLHKSRSLDQVSGNARTAINMDYEVLTSLQKDESHIVRTMSQGNYEPDDLNLMLNREEHGRSGYDPALDYEMQAQITETTKFDGKKKEATIVSKEAPKKGVKDQKLKAEKRLFAGTRREKPYKLSPSEDARARAEKLRSFKADLQKLKKEKEEEQVKRLEALKLERQKRIAAKTAVNPPQSPLPTQQAKKQQPKLSPVSHKGSKFSDTDPGSSSPLQRSTLKNISKVSPDSSKVSKPGRVIDRSNESGNRLTRSASSLSVRKEENNGLTSEAKATMARIRRLSEPKITVNHNTSEKSRTTEGASRRRVSMGAEMKKMPSTSSLNKTKSGDVQELKSRTHKVSTVSTQKKSSKEMVHKPNDKILSGARPNANLGRGNANISSIIDEDDSTVVEKTVVMLECERPSTQVTRASEVEGRGKIMQSDPFNPDGKLDNDITVPPPASPIFVKEVDQEPSNGQVKGKSGIRLMETEETHEQEVLPNTKNICTTEEPYRAPHARLSSVEDPCMGKSDYVKALSGSSESAEAYTQTANVYVPDAQRPRLVKIPEVASVKQQGKESSKGFRRLLKFGKKSSATSEPNVESNKAILDASGADKDVLNGSSSEAFTLKNLLTQEEGSSAGNTPKKSSRSFSLLSPFRSKTSERKSAS